MKSPLEISEAILQEANEILLLPDVPSAAQRIQRFREHAIAHQNTLAYAKGFSAEHQQLIALVSKLLACFTPRSLDSKKAADSKRAIREIEGLREALRELTEYIDRVRP